MKTLSSLCWLALNLTVASWAQSPQPLYRNDFQQAALDQVPDDLLVIDGAFAVKEEQRNRFLELPGAPLDSYGVLFGPTQKDGVQASARVFGTNKGRRFPTFAVGLDGVGGYRLQVSPGKKLLELFRGDSMKLSVPYTWASGRWTHLKIQVLKTAAGWKIEGKAWQEGASEPANWLISTEEKEDLPTGRAGVFGSPFADTPIRFDDLQVSPTQAGH